MIPLPVVAFCAMTCLVAMFLQVHWLWRDNGQLQDEHAAITRELADVWTLMGQVLDYCQHLAGEEPATTPQPTVTPDTQPSEAIVIGGARVTGKALEDLSKRDAATKRHADWVTSELARFKFAEGGRR